MPNQNLPTVQEKARSLRDYMNGEAIKGQMQVALPKWLSIDRFLRVVFGALIRNPKLMDCTKESLLQSVMQCAQLGLEPILGRAYLIPYNNNKNVGGQWVKQLECQFQPGYQGLVDLARRSGAVEDIRARVVYTNDVFDIDYGTNRLTHKPHLFDDPGDPMGAYTFWRLAGGIEGFEFMPLHEIYKRRERSQSWQRAKSYPNDKNAQKCPWVEWPEEMVKKTALKNHIKLLPMSVDFMQAVEIDNNADLDPSRQLTAGAGYGAPALTLPDSPALPLPDPAEFDTEYADIMTTGKGKNKKPNPTFTAFFELAREGNTVDGVPPDDDQLKILALTDRRGREAFRNAFKDFEKLNAKGKTPGKTKATTKKAAANDGKGAKTATKSKAKPKAKADGDAAEQSEYDALQQSDDWQSMTIVLETNPTLYKKYNGKDVRGFDDAAEFLKLVYADPDYQDEMPGA